MLTGSLPFLWKSVPKTNLKKNGLSILTSSLLFIKCLGESNYKVSIRNRLLRA